MEAIVVLGARRYAFRDDDGRMHEGVTLHYLAGGADDTVDSRGLVPLRVGASEGVLLELVEVPGVYLAEFRQRPGAGGRPVLQVVHLEYRAPVDVRGLLASV